MFNPADEPRGIGVGISALGLSGTVPVRDLLRRAADGTARGRFTRKLEPHGAGLYWLAQA